MRRVPAWWSDRSPAFRLAVAYAGIIAVLGLLFSLVLYQFADNQIADGLRRQYFELHRPSLGGDPGMAPPDRDATMAAIAPLLASARSALLWRLFYFNLTIITFGSAASYWLAKRTMRPIERALEAQTRFTADASHELRTPLAVMRTEIEIARADPGLTKAQAFELLDSNLEEVGKLHALAEALLRLARSGQGALTLEPVPVARLVDEALARVAGRAKLAHIKLVNDATDFTVPADAPSLTELLVILLDNAVKYSPTGTAVTIGAVRQGHAGTITVTDQGRGIAAADLPRIFDRFYRADRSRTKADIEGHGLGLSIAKQIADLHGATIEVASTPGRGSVFTVRLGKTSV